MSRFRKNKAEGMFGIFRALIDMASVKLFLYILTAFLMIIIVKNSTDRTITSDDPNQERAQRPTGVALRTQVSWDANMTGNLDRGEECKTPADRGFQPHLRQQECSSADVDLWVVRVKEDGAELFYNSRGQADTLFSATPDDRGFERNEDATMFRYEQLVAQYALLPPGRYHIVVDLFQEDLHLPNRTVKVCGTALYKEGSPDQRELFEGCVEVATSRFAPQTVTLVSFTIDAENDLVVTSVDRASSYSLDRGFYSGK